MRKVMMMVALVALLVALFATAAFAKNFQCTRLNCEGTNNPDTIYERGGEGVPDNISGRRGGDFLDASRFGVDVDNLNGGRGNDVLDARDGDNFDTLNGGRGYDECFGDGVDNPDTDADEGDVYVNCEEINGVEQ